MTKLPFDHPTEPDNISLIRQNLRAEKLDLKLRYRLLISLAILIVTSIIRTAFQFGFIGTIIITAPFFASLAWCTPFWRAKHAKPIPFAVLHQYLTVFPKKLQGHYVKVKGKISYVSKQGSVIRIVSSDNKSPNDFISVSLNQLDGRTYITETEDSIAQSIDPIAHPIAVGDNVEISGDIICTSTKEKKITLIAARTLYHLAEDEN